MLPSMETIIIHEIDIQGKHGVLFTFTMAKLNSLELDLFLAMIVDERPRWTPNENNTVGPHVSLFRNGQTSRL
jgi:hypothetical protein